MIEDVLGKLEFRGRSYWMKTATMKENEKKEVFSEPKVYREIQVLVYEKIVRDELEGKDKPIWIMGTFLARRASKDKQTFR